MYADRVDAAAKTSIKDRLNGNSIGDSARLRHITGKRQRQDDKWEHDLYDDGGPRVSNHKIDARDLRLKLQRKSFQQASPRSGVRDLREKLSGTMNSQPANVDPPKPKIAVAKPARRSVAVEAPEPEIKKTANVVSRKGYQQKGDKANPSINFKVKEKKGGSHKKSILGWLYYTTDSSVDGFLQSLGLEKYLITFQAEEVDMTALVHMNDEDLKALGIPMGPRKKILLALESRA